MLSCLKGSREKTYSVVVKENRRTGELKRDPEKVYSVPVDPGHEKCAISGQRFETFWNEEVEEWHYKDAIRLQQPFGGAAAGALVHTSTLHQGDDEPQGDGKRGADGPEGGAAAKRPRV